MPVYKLSKEDRCRILNITPELHDQAQRLVAEADNAHHDAMLRHLDLAARSMTAEPPPPHLSWYEACRLVDPDTDHGKYHFLIDNGHGDHGGHMTMTFSRNVAQMLQRELGITLDYVHAVHHRPQDHP